MEYVKVSITKTGASLFSSKYSVFDEETKTFPSLNEAKTYLKTTYKGHRRSPTYVDKADGTTVQTGYVYSYRNADWSHSPVETWNQQDWVDITTVVETPVAV